MIKIKIWPIILFCLICCFAEAMTCKKHTNYVLPNFEVLAFNYFADSILLKEFKKSERIFYDHSVSNIVSGSTFIGCFKDYYTNKNSIVEKRDSSAVQVDLVLEIKNNKLLPNKKNPKIKNRCYLMEVHKANSFQIGTFFVEIVVHKLSMRTHFWIEMNLNGHQTRWCAFDVIN